MPSPSGLQTGIPIGHPNSIVLISFPMRFLSSGESPFSHSRTGSPPRPCDRKSPEPSCPVFRVLWTGRAIPAESWEAYSRHQCTIYGTRRAQISRCSFSVLTFGRIWRFWSLAVPGLLAAGEFRQAGQAGFPHLFAHLGILWLPGHDGGRAEDG